MGKYAPKNPWRCSEQFTLEDFEWNKLNKFFRNFIFSELIFFGFSEYWFTTSVTRFGKISPLWQKNTSLWQIFYFSFLIWQNAESTLQICDIIGLVFIVANGQIFKNKLTIWSHCLLLTHLQKTQYFGKQLRRNVKIALAFGSNYVLHNQPNYFFQCDQIGQFLKVLGKKIPCKSSSKYLASYCAILKSITFKQNLLWLLFG